MTYRERRLRKAERLRGWAEKRAQKSGAAFTGARRALDGIEPGQPILVGHHSEKRHRGALERHDQRMRAGFEHQEKARSMESRAAEIEHQANGAIYSDDPDAIEALEARIATLEAERTRKRAINTEIRKGKGWAERLTLTDTEKRDLENAARFAGSTGYPSYVFSNLSGNIGRQRKRLEQLKARARIAALPEDFSHWPDGGTLDATDAHNAIAAAALEPATPAELAAEIAQAEAAAAPIAEAPFSLTPPANVRHPKQGRLL